MCRGREWLPCWRSIGCVRQAASWQSNSAGIPRRRRMIYWAWSRTRSTTRGYRCLDRTLTHKTKLERHLKHRYGELFGAELDVLLYDSLNKNC